MSDRQIVNISGFINSVRSLGITTTDAVNELVDNSFDANAKNIWISLLKNKNNSLCLRIEDDGMGIPKEALSKILAFGGRLPGEGVTTGKFGWGLSSSACCQSLRTEVFSKRKDEKFYFNYIDIKGLEKSKGDLPETTQASPFKAYKNLCLSEKSPSGTVIVLCELTNPERRREDALLKMLSENLAEVHRRYLASGRNIYIQKAPIRFYDPLLLMDGSNGLDKVSKSEDYSKIDPIVYKNILGEDGKPARVEVKIAKLPVAEIMKKSLQATYPFMVNVANQGFYIMRHNRQIGSGQTLHLFSKNPMFNYFRAEISFPPVLDEMFGVQTNKSRFSLDDQLREELEKRLEKVITQIRDDIKEEADAYKAERNKSIPASQSISEEIASEAAKLLKPSGYKLDKEAAEKGKQELEKEKNKRIQEIKKSTLSKEKKDEAITRLNNAFQQDRIFVRTVGVIGTGEFYKIKHKGTKLIEVIINEKHGFYREIYERASQIPEQQVLLDLFLFTLAISEDIYYENKNVREFYESQRREWSTNMSRFLETARRKLDSTDLSDEA